VPRVRWWRDVLGVAWVVAAAVAVMAPALVHGIYLGPSDILSQLGLTQHAGVNVIHNRGTEDQMLALIPWSTLVWTQVHHGQLPLWNPYSVLGMPLAFNWQSAPLSVPSLIGYLFPLRLAYTAQVLVTQVIAGTGAYVLGRTLKLGVLGCVTAATVFELSGSFMGWLGWPNASVMSWAGWLFAATILVVRGRHRARDVTFLAVVVALAIYAGMPETGLVIAAALIVFVIVFLVLRARQLGHLRLAVRSALDVAVAAVAGAALAAPLVLPGAQITDMSLRSAVKVDYPLPFHDLTYLLFQGFDGVPINGLPWFGNRTANYVQTAAYVGVIALVLAVLAVASRWRRPVVVAFGAVAAVMAVVAFGTPVLSLIDTLPFVGKVQWHYALFPMDFAIAILAGVGMDVLVRSHGIRAVRAWLGGGFVAAGLVLLGVWAVGRGHLVPRQAHIRAHSFIWPAASTLLGLMVVGILYAVHRRAPRHQAQGRRSWIGAGRWAGLCLLACETAFLVAAGAPLWSSSSTVLRPTPAEVTLERAVGSSEVGLGYPSAVSPTLGIVPDVNILDGIHELAIYDPVVPRAYPDAWLAATGESSEVQFIFAPVVDTATAARRFGVGFVLEPDGSPGPTGSVFDKEIGDHEALYRIPGAAAATVSPLGPGGSLPSPDAPGRPVPVAHPKPSSWKLETDAATTQVLRLRLTDVPGWHGTIDGRALKLEPFSGVMLQAIVPPGHHTIELSYWPSAFTVGLGLAVGSAVGLAIALVTTWVRRRRKRVSAPGTAEPAPA
jgi:hypothetical protein